MANKKGAGRKKIKRIGRLYTLKEYNKMEPKPLLFTAEQFIKEKEIDQDIAMVNYRMKCLDIDYIQPMKDRFILLTETTKKFFRL